MERCWQETGGWGKEQNRKQGISPPSSAYGSFTSLHGPSSHQRGSSWSQHFLEGYPELWVTDNSIPPFVSATWGDCYYCSFMGFLAVSYITLSSTFHLCNQFPAFTPLWLVFLRKPCSIDPVISSISSLSPFHLIGLQSTWLAFLPSHTGMHTHTRLWFSPRLKKQRQASVVWKKLTMWVDSEVTLSSTAVALNWGILSPSATSRE